MRNRPQKRILHVDLNVLTWERWRYELTNPTLVSYTLTVQTVSPLLADGTYPLFISSDYAGQFWALDSARARWEVATAESK